VGAARLLAQACNVFRAPIRFDPAESSPLPQSFGWFGDYLEGLGVLRLQLRDYPGATAALAEALLVYGRIPAAAPRIPLVAATKAQAAQLGGQPLSAIADVGHAVIRALDLSPEQGIHVMALADDFIVGFQHEADARRFLADLRGRFAKFGLELHEGKTRLIEFGRHAARQRKARGLPRPETFDFLSFTHACGKTRDGRFGLRRFTIAKRMRAKLRQARDELWRRHLPVPEQGAWLGNVVRGHCAYYAVPGNSNAVREFRTQTARHWYRALRRRSQRTSLNWERMDRLATRWLPQAKITHPWPSVQFDARTQGRSPVR
jgi:hypothetical protein